MSRKNYALEAQFEKWFLEIYQEGNELKAYILNEKIQQDKELTIDQAIMIMRKINRITALQIQVTRATLYAKEHPNIGRPQMQETIRSMCKALKMIEKKYCEPFEILARNKIDEYINIQNSQREPLGYEGLLKANRMPTKEQILNRLNNEKETSEISRSYIARKRWQNAMAQVIDRNRSRADRWRETYEIVETYYRRVDDEVKSNVRAYAHEQFRILNKQHECFMKWLNLFESAMILAEKNAKELYKNLDVTANRNSKIAWMLLRASASAALTPILLNNFIDPTLAIFNTVIQQLEISKGNIELNLNQTQALYKLTGFLPDPNGKTYITAYEKLAQETIYEKIERYKKYLQHKINALSKSAEVANIMAEDSKIWGDHTPDEIIAAQRMKIIDDSSYDKSIGTLSKPENENMLINEISKSFLETVKEIFQPLQEQYGSKESWNAIHELIDKIQFDETRVGPDSHNQFLDNSLVKALANQIEIYFIVKYLVENTRYFGGSSHNDKLYRGHFEPDTDDFSFGYRPDDVPCNHLISALIKRLLQIDDDALKQKLNLIHKDVSENDIIRHHPLVYSDYASYADTTQNTLSKACPCLFSPSAPSLKHIKRQEMISEIINVYYNQDLSIFLQHELIRFGKSHDIHLTPPSSHQNDTHIIPESNWMSDAQLRELSTEKTKSYIEQTDNAREVSAHHGKLGLLYYRSNQKTNEATMLRSKEVNEEVAASTRMRFKN